MFGKNILNLALPFLPQQAIMWFRFLGRTTNAIGYDVPAYDAGTQIFGSFQPVERQLYEAYGLDFNKIYFIFYSANNILEVLREATSDQLVFNSQTYQVESSTGDWYAIDGWRGIICVQVSTPSPG